MRRIVRGLRRRAVAVVRFCLSPWYRLVRNHYHSEFGRLRLELAALRQELAVLRGASLDTHTLFLQQLADEFVGLQMRLEARNDHSHAA